MNNARLILFSFLFLTACGCGGKPAPADASLEHFKDYYAGEMFLVERSRLSGEDSLELRRELDSLRAAFGLSTGARDTLLAWFRDSLPRWELFLGDVAARLDERAKAGDRAPGAGGSAPDAR